MEHFVKGLVLAQELRVTAKEAAVELFPVAELGPKPELEEVVEVLRQQVARLTAKDYIEGVLFDVAVKALEAAPPCPPPVA